MFVSVEGQYVGERLTLLGEPLSGFFMSNVVLSSREDRRLSVTAGVYNALNATYADPGAEEHAQDSIQQDGRTFLARFRVRF
jgi:iron complex outermembrane receptor protein